MKHMEFKKSDYPVANMVRACYPEWKGRRRIKVYSKEKYRVNDYWDGGSRDYCEFYHIPTGRILSMDSVNYEHQERGNPYNQRMGYVHLTPDIAVVESSFFRGKQRVNIHLHPDTWNEWSEKF